MSAPLEAALDELYAVAPEHFIETRKALAAKLRADGDAESAKTILGQAKPTRAAHLLNQLARTWPDDIAELAAVGKRLMEAQRRAQGDALREAIADQRRLVRALSAKASELEPATADRGTIDAALYGATTSADRAEELRLGRFAKAPEASVSFFDVGATAPLTAPAAEQKPKTTPPAPVTDLAAARKRMEQKRRLEAEERSARAAADAAESAAAQAEEAVEILKQELPRHEATAKELERAAEEATARAAEARDVAEQTRLKLEAVELEAQALKHQAAALKVKHHQALRDLK